MKQVIPVLLLFLLTEKLSAQLYAGFTDFDQSNQLFITIDTTSGNLWQIGKPDKAFFNDAFSQPNVILTDTLSNYPVNNTSTFQILLPYSFVGYGSEIRFQHRYQTDTLHDGGYIEFSHDKGQTWYNVVADSPYLQQGGEIFLYNFYTADDSLADGTFAFSGTSGGWQESIITFGFICVGQRDFSDSILVRFVFKSDSVADNYDGWMIDDIQITEYVCSDIAAINNSFFDFNLYPNPADDVVSFLLNKKLQLKATVEIKDILGKTCLREQFSPGQNEYLINLNNLAGGIYEVCLHTGTAVYSRKFLKK